MSTFFTLLSLATLTLAVERSVTPHDLYSSSVGVLGCKIDTNRVAYFPDAVDCNNICVRITHEGRTLELLRIDQSGGAFDISYDAWNFLTTGASAIDEPSTGGGVNMEVEDVPAENCKSLLKGDGGKMAFSASNSMNFISSCLSQPDSFVAQNFELFNIQDATCKCGHDEKCELDLAVSNQPSCPNQLGTGGSLGDSVFNIEFGTGKRVAAAGVC